MVLMQIEFVDSKWINSRSTVWCMQIEFADSNICMKQNKASFDVAMCLLKYYLEDRSRQCLPGQHEAKGDLFGKHRS